MIKNEELNYICYCNKITKQEIIDTVKLTGLKKINGIKKYLRDEIITDCENRHPLKRCCSPEFKKVITESLIMTENQKKETKKKKGFLSKMFDKLDKKLEEKSKKQSSCCGPKNPGDKSSCC